MDNFNWDNFHCAQVALAAAPVSASKTAPEVAPWGLKNTAPTDAVNHVSPTGASAIMRGRASDPSVSAERTPSPPAAAAWRPTDLSSDPERRC